jgi:hypothetical protein
MKTGWIGIEEAIAQATAALADVNQGRAARLVRRDLPIEAHSTRNGGAFLGRAHVCFWLHRARSNSAIPAPVGDNPSTENGSRTYLEGGLAAFFFGEAQDGRSVLQVNA